METVPQTTPRQDPGPARRARTQAEPSVVSVMVVSEPGEWFEQTLEALANQTYRNIRHVFLIADADPSATQQRIVRHIPNAFMRQSVNPDSFGASVNEVLQLVEGNNGLFLLSHDDVAPEPDAVGVLVTEMMRSKAGIVGPKLLDWHDPRILQHVGLGVDRLGEVDPLIEPGEVDQEQHDAVRDVFVVPSAFVLVRADLFRALNGFDPAITFYGEDIDLCWRAHHLGARVMIVPDARVRHIEQLAERRPALNVQTLQSRHRMRSVAVLTGGSRLLVRSLQMVLLTFAELVIGLFTGRVGEALHSVRALFGLIGRTPAVMSRRSEISDQRKVPEREVLGLQVRGSSRLNSFLRGRETATFVGEHTTVRRWRQVGYGPLLTWVVIVVALIIGSRKFIADGIPAMGEFLPFPSARQLVGDFTNAFDSRGLGATSAKPTSWFLSAVGSMVVLTKMGIFRTVFVLGAALVGVMGAWRLGAIFPIGRARITTAIVYAGTPLIPWALGRGELSTLVVFAGLPWVLHQLGRVAGLRPADPEATHPALVDGVARVSDAQRLQAGLIAILVTALTVAFVPAAALIVPLAGLALAGATVIARGRTDVAKWIAIGALATLVGGLALNIPWVFSWTWTDVVGVNGGASGRSVVAVTTMASTSVKFAVLALGLYLPVVAAVALTSAWRFTWSVRGMVLVVVFAGAATMKEFGILSRLLPPAGMLMVPAVLGLGLCGGALVSGMQVDVLAKGFGWRQPIAVLANAAMVLGLAPAALGIGAGDWGADNLPIARLFETQFPPMVDSGDYRVLVVGDPDLLPVPGREFEPGIGFAVLDPGELTFEDRSVTPGTAADTLIREGLRQIALGTTSRAGRIFAPLGIRYLVIPESRGVESLSEGDSVLNESLTLALSKQLDIGRVPSAATMRVFQNQSFVPVGAVLTGATAEASKKAGPGSLVRADLGSNKPTLVGVSGDVGVSSPVTPEVVHLGIPFDPRFGLELGGTELPARKSFGVATAFDVANAGEATLVYRSGISRGFWLFVAGLLWFAVIAVAFAPRSRLGRGRGRGGAEETLIDLVGEATLDDFDRYDHVVTEGEPYAVGEPADGSDAASPEHPRHDGEAGTDETTTLRRDDDDHISPAFDPGMTAQIEIDPNQRGYADVFESDDGEWL